MRLEFAPEARADLIAIGDWIAQDNPTRAESFIEELAGAASVLTDQPRGFPLVPRYEHRGVRRRAWRDYLIFYAVDPDRVFVLRILHGAQDYEPLLFGEG